MNPAALVPLPEGTSSLVNRLHRLTVADHWLYKGKVTGAPRWTRRQEVARALWEATPWEAQAPSPVPEIDVEELSLERFAELTLAFRRPLVIRRFGEGNEAVAKWTPEALMGRMGEYTCTVVEQDHDAVYNPHDSGRVLHTMTYAEFVAKMEEAPLYLHNSTEFAAQRPELLDELDLASINRAFSDPKSSWDELWSTNLFVGSQKVFSSLHCAPGGNFFMQVAGRKTWTLVDPALGPWLLPVLSKPFNHCLSGYGSFRLQREVAPDHVIFRLPRLEVTLEPGDLLYNPPWWWHEVENHGSTIGCAIRHSPMPFKRQPTIANHRLYSAISMYPKLWTFIAMNWFRHKLTGKGQPARKKLNVEFAKALNGARQRSE